MYYKKSTVTPTRIYWLIRFSLICNMALLTNSKLSLYFVLIDVGLMMPPPPGHPPSTLPLIFLENLLYIFAVVLCRIVENLIINDHTN